MKIITNDSIYVQKNDIRFLSQINLTVPSFIFSSVYGLDSAKVNEANKYEFVRFDDKKEIEYFRSLDWILDYDAVKDLDEEQIIQLGKVMVKNMNVMINEFNLMSNDVRLKNMQAIAECEKYEFKIHSLRDYLLFKKGYINFEFPEELNKFLHLNEDCKKKKLKKEQE